MSKSLKKIQKKRIGNAKVFWINNFKKLRNGPVIFFGNEFFDAIPIKQFKREKNYLMEKHYTLRKDCKIIENFKISTKKNSRVINSYKTQLMTFLRHFQFHHQNKQLCSYQNDIYLPYHLVQ